MPDEPHTRIDAHSVVYIEKQIVAGDARTTIGAASPLVPIHQHPRNLPPPQSSFAGRERELRALHTRLSKTGPAVVGITQQAMSGHGGIGKTSLAIQYAWTYLEHYPAGVFFLSCERAAVPPLAELAPYLGIPVAETNEETAVRVKAHLETAGPSLLILDNIENQAQWREGRWNEKLPQNPCCRLITTRARQLSGVSMIPIERLSAADGLQLLANFRADAADEADAAKWIVEWFDGLAVGLTVTGVYMQMHPDLIWTKYASSLRNRGLAAVRATEAHVQDALEYEGRVDSVLDDVMAALPAAERLVLEYSAVLPEDNVYSLWLTELLSVGNVIQVEALPGYEDAQAEQIIGALVDRQLLRPRAEDATLLGLHRVLRRRVLEQLQQSGEQESLLNAVLALAVRRGQAVANVRTDPSMRHELTPLANLSEALDDLGQSNAGLTLATCLSGPLLDVGRNAELKALLTRFLGENRLGAASSETALTLLNNLATALTGLGEFFEALQQMKRAVQIAEEFYPRGHPELVRNYSSLVKTLTHAGELSQARSLMVEVIGIIRRHFHADHPLLAVGYQEFARILLKLEELDEAKRVMNRAIGIAERQFPANHPTLAACNSSMAMILKALGEQSEARRRLQRAIEIGEQHYQSDHPSVAIDYVNLGHLELEAGNKIVACTLFWQAHTIFEKHYLPSHLFRQQLTETLHKNCGIKPPD